jgi:preprotein translocase subunit SecG
MEIVKLILTIIQVLTAVFVVVMVLMQSGKSNGLSAALGGGGSDTFLAKNKSRGLDAKLARATKWMAAVFMVLTLVLNLI